MSSQLVCQRPSWHRLLPSKATLPLRRRRPHATFSHLQLPPGSHFLHIDDVPDSTSELGTVHHHSYPPSSSANNTVAEYGGPLPTRVPHSKMNRCQHPILPAARYLDLSHRPNT